MCTEHANASEEFEKFLEITELIFLGIYSVEAVIKIYALGMKEYWNNTWNRFDLLVTLIAIAGYVGFSGKAVIFFGIVFLGLCLKLIITAPVM